MPQQIDFSKYSGPVSSDPYPSGPGYPTPAVPGNIQWYGRQKVKMAGPPGSYGTVYSASREENGQEVLFPMIYDGALHSEEEAWQHYKQTGQHMGKFKNVGDADTYGSKYHEEAAAGKYDQAQQIDFSKYAAPNAGINTAPAQKSWLDSTKDFASEAWNQVNPKAAIEGLSQAVRHPVDTGKGLLLSQAEVEKKAEESFKKGDYGTGVRHVLNYLIPVLGPQIDRAGDLMQSGEYAKGAGATVGIGANVAVPELIKGANLKLPQSATNLSERVYQSALKPPPGSYSTAEVSNMVKTGLDQGIPVSQKGIETLQARIADLGDKVKQELAAQPNASINKFSVASRLGDTAKKFANQVTPESDLAAVSETGNEFLANQPTQIPAQAAQALKQGTYQQLKSRNFGEVKSATIEAQKSLARGIKEELEAQFPEIKGLNAQQGKLIGLDEALERAVRRIDNRDIFGLGTKIAATGAAAAFGMGEHSLGAGLGTYAATSILHKVVTDPMVQSKLAIALSKAGKGSIGVSTAFSRVAGYTNQLGNSVKDSSGQAAQ